MRRSTSRAPRSSGLVQLVISEAVQLRASDIHVEPFEDRVRIRYRIDGVLIERDSPPRRLLGALLSRIKILAKMDIAERRRPQDGRIKITVGEKQFDLRVSVLPTNHGQSVVMRLLDKDNIRVGVRQLGLVGSRLPDVPQSDPPPERDHAGHRSDWFGKDHHALRRAERTEPAGRENHHGRRPRRVLPAGHQPGRGAANIGLDFARIIRAMLRQAPNVILVGEMRDAETAQMGIQASLTGHLVFSTLHTNDAPGAITRMIDMGVPAYLVSSSVIAVMAQRLVRVICAKCKQPYTPARRRVGRGRHHAGNGGRCHVRQRARLCTIAIESGYRGRLGIFELMHDDLPHSGIGVRRSADAADPQSGRWPRNDNTLQRRNPQGPEGRDHDRRGLPGRQESRGMNAPSWRAMRSRLGAARSS